MKKRNEAINPNQSQLLKIAESIEISQDLCKN